MRDLSFFVGHEQQENAAESISSDLALQLVICFAGFL